MQEQTGKFPANFPGPDDVFGSSGISDGWGMDKYATPPFLCKGAVQILEIERAGNFISPCFQGLTDSLQGNSYESGSFKKGNARSRMFIVPGAGAIAHAVVVILSYT